MTREHGVADEDARRDEEQDGRVGDTVRYAAEQGGCCLLQGLFLGSGVALVGIIPLLMR